MTLAVGTKRAVGYFRVSDPHQTGERHSSLETQEERFRLHCERHGYTAVATFTDVKSGRRDDRHEYQRMLAYIPDAQANVIVVQWLDRFGRKPREILRRYWAAAFQLPPGERTTAEFSRALATRPVPDAELSAAAVDFLRRCDERKFSPAPAAVPPGAVKGALEFIARTEAMLKQTQVSQAEH